jgi:hypothetical protein
MGLIGIGFTIFSATIGLAVVVLAIVVFLLLRYFGNDTTISCHDNGFSVKVVNKRKGSLVQEYEWSDVTETLYFERESGGEDSPTTRYFSVTTDNGVAFSLHEIKGFNELIDIFNRKTNHLPYLWEKPKGFSSSYKKQQRELS